MHVPDYSKSLDNSLNKIDSLFNTRPQEEDFNLEDLLEGVPSEVLEQGIFGALSRTAGIEFNADRGGDSFLQSRNFASGASGWRLDSSGKVTAVSGQIGSWRIGATTLTGGTLILDSAGFVTAGVIRTAASGERVQLDDTGVHANRLRFFQGSGGTDRGRIYGSAAALNIVAVQAGDAVIISTGDGLGMTIFGGGTGTDVNGLLQSDTLNITGLAQVDSFRIDQTPVAETPTATHTATISLNGVTYRFLCLV